jgi:hypothetical protein
MAGAKPSAFHAFCMNSAKRVPSERDAERANALENWRRVTELCRCSGRPESDATLLDKLERWAPGAPKDKLNRSRLGLKGGAGALRKDSAQALVGPLLGVNFNTSSGRPESALEPYTGPAPEWRLAHLRSLSEPGLFDLADDWVQYLRRERDTVPEAAPESTQPGPPAQEPGSPELESQSEPEIVAQTTATGKRWRFWPLALGAVLVPAVALFLHRSGAREARGPDPRGGQSVVARLRPLSTATPAQAAAAVSSGSAAPAPAPPDEAARVTVECERGGERFVLADRARVREKDRLWLQVEVDEPLFATLALLAADSTLKPLYPKRGSVPIPPKRKTRLPRASTQFLSPNNEPGLERLLVLFTTAPLANGLALALPWLEQLQREGRWPEDWPLPARDPSKIAKAGAINSGSGADSTLLTRGIVVSEASAKPNEAPELVHLQFLTFDHRSAEP